jgi:hypothetical protein
MSAFEAFLAFMVVMGVISIPFAAVITRSRSPVGRAIAERIRRRTEARFGTPAPTALPNGNREGSPDIERRLQLVEDKHHELAEISRKIDFLERLIERSPTDR